MLQDDFKIVQYEPEHKAQVIELQKGLWSPSVEHNAAYLEWKHLRNPYLSEPLIYLIMHGERVVGMRGYFGAKWQFGTPRQTLVVPCSGDLIVAPEFRNRGLMTRIMKASLQEVAAKGYRYVFNMSAGPTTLVSQMAMGWRSIGSMQTMRFAAPVKKSAPSAREVLKKSPLLVSVYRRIRSRARKQLAGFDARVGQLRHRIDAHVSIEQSPRPTAMAELTARIGGDERFRHVGDEQYFAWRFQNPRGGYRFLFWQDKQLEGYLVYACRHSGESHCSILDWEGTSHQVRAGLIQALVQLAGFDEFRTWSATLGEDNRRILRDAGFQRLEESVTKHVATVLIRPTRDDLPEADWVLGNQRLLDLRNWDLRMIYSDGF